MILNTFSFQHGAAAAPAGSEAVADIRTGREGLTEELFSLADIFRWMNISLRVTCRNTSKEILHNSSLPCAEGIFLKINVAEVINSTEYLMMTTSQKISVQIMPRLFPRSVLLPCLLNLNIMG